MKKLKGEILSQLADWLKYCASVLYRFQPWAGWVSERSDGLAIGYYWIANWLKAIQVSQSLSTDFTLCVFKATALRFSACLIIVCILLNSLQNQSPNFGEQTIPSRLARQPATRIYQILAELLSWTARRISASAKNGIRRTCSGNPHHTTVRQSASEPVGIMQSPCTVAAVCILNCVY